MPIGREWRDRRDPRLSLGYLAGRPRRWPSRAMPESARPWSGSTSSRPLAAQLRCFPASRRWPSDHSPSRHSTTCSATSPSEVLPALADPRRRAVQAALLRGTLPGPRAGLSETHRRRPERQVLARGVLDALRILSGDAPLVIAVDDAQWLDRPSASVLEFCFRRLKDEPVSILLTFREDSGVFPLGLDRALPPDRVRRVPLGPLSLGAIGEIVRSRLGAALPRYVLTRLYEACAGNPFYALECARALLERPRMPRTNEPIPIPSSLGDLVRRRVCRLTPRVRQVGRLVAASSDPRERLIRAACDDGESWGAIDEAVDDGIIERDGDVLRFTHPLLRSVLYGEMTTERTQGDPPPAGNGSRGYRGTCLASCPRGGQAQRGDRRDARPAPRDTRRPEARRRMRRHSQEQAARLTPAGQAGAARERTVRAADNHFRAGDISPQPGTDPVRPGCVSGRPASRAAARPAGHDPLPPERLAAGGADVPSGVPGGTG